MDIENYDFNNKKDFKRLCKDAAEGCYYPAQNQRQHAMSLVIQNLILPSDIEAFDITALEGYIRNRLQVRMAARTVIEEARNEQAKK